MTAPYAANSATSRLAAAQIEPDTNRLRRIVLSWIKSSMPHGLTCDEIEAHAEMRHQTASARIVELKNRGEIEARTDAQGNEIHRKTRSGRAATVWVIRTP